MDKGWEGGWRSSFAILSRFRSLSCRWELSHLLSLSYLAHPGSHNNRLLSTKSSMCSPSGKCRMHLGLGHAQMSRKLLILLCRRIGHFQPSLVCGADAQLDIHYRSLITGRTCNPIFLVPVKKPIKIEVIHVGENLHIMKMLLDIFN